ncbi:hypothetical protein K435DRAFT_813075 [Dendrothele bispora CBS 962.96]|uniref:Uncharacterized protein n=1 Tax=Dendrothele bispora (strain CBS 962.96) TaxID=1314807 RepID=A0A4S8KMF7_DENBC|nr:hypothetical protein K435DRAFT_813075 [Dendrothele bispora CBS 962.96]
MPNIVTRHTKGSYRSATGHLGRKKSALTTHRGYNTQGTWWLAKLEGKKHRSARGHSSGEKGRKGGKQEGTELTSLAADRQQAPNRLGRAPSTEIRPTQYRPASPAKPRPNSTFRPTFDSVTITSPRKSKRSTDASIALKDKPSVSKTSPIKAKESASVTGKDIPSPSKEITVTAKGIHQEKPEFRISAKFGKILSYPILMCQIPQYSVFSMQNIGKIRH